MARSKPAARVMRHPAARMMAVRQIHAYLSIFAAPIVLFFAFTGSLQLFSLHEPHGDYQPPELVEKLAAVHKDQRFAVKARHQESALRTPVTKQEGEWMTPPVNSEAEPDAPPPIRELALKWLFLASALVLMVSTCLGVWMAVTQNRHKWVLLALFLLGAAAPVAILMM